MQRYNKHIDNDRDSIKRIKVIILIDAVEKELSEVKNRVGRWND